MARRLGLTGEDCELIERLVREHLTLIELATRRDPDDARTVDDLIEAVGGRLETLSMLRALTDPAVAGGEFYGPRFVAFGSAAVRETPTRAARARSRRWSPGAAWGRRNSRSTARASST